MQKQLFLLSDPQWSMAATGVRSEWLREDIAFGEVRTGGNVSFET